MSELHDLSGPSEHAIPALDREHLFEACRAIYQLAGSDFILPPLTRDAGQGASQTRRVHTWRVGQLELGFFAALDETRADPNAGPESRLPIRFQIGMRDLAAKTGLTQPCERDRYEMLRAFFLGAKAPISVERLGQERRFQVSAQLASTYSVQFGELIDASDDRLPKDICDAVARAIYARTRDFFASPLEGLETWSLRAAQDLFGEAKPAPEVFWPFETPAIVAPAAADAVPAVLVTVPKQPRRALAASIAAGLILPAAAALGLAMFKGEATPVVSAHLAIDPPELPALAITGLLPVSSISGPAGRLPMEVALRADVAPSPQVAIYPSRFVLVDQTTRLDPGPKFPNFAEIAALLPNSDFAARDFADARARHVAQSVARKSDAPVGVAARLEATPASRVAQITEPTLGRRAAMAISGVFRGIKRIPMQIAQLVKPQPAQR